MGKDEDVQIIAVTVLDLWLKNNDEKNMAFEVIDMT